MHTPSSINVIFTRLGRSSFRRGFRLAPRELKYLRDRGRDVIRNHARRFVEERLTPADPPHDGRQTPMRGHPVFIAQHATATCCRSCLAKWHSIPKGRALTDAEAQYTIDLIGNWLDQEACASDVTRAPTLFDLAD